MGHKKFIALIVFSIFSLFYFLGWSFLDLIKSPLYSKAEKLLMDGDYSQALKITEKDLLNHSRDGALRYIRAVAFKNLKDYDSAINEADAALKLGYPEVQALLLKADIYGGIKKDYDLQKDLADKAISIDPTMDEAYFQRARAYKLKKDFKKALDDLNTVISMRGDFYYDALLEESEIYIELKEYDKALEKNSLFLDKYPYYGEALFQLYLIKNAQKKLKEAFGALSIAIEKGSSRYLYERALFLEKQGNYVRAYDDMKSYIYHTKKDANTLYNLALLAFRADKNKEAINFVKELMKIKGKKDCYYYLLRGRILFKEGDFKGSYSDMKKAASFSDCAALAEKYIAHLKNRF